VLAGTFNIIPEKPFIFIVRLVLIALAVGFAGNVPAHFILLLLQVLPGQYQPALFFFDGLITALAYSFAYYFVIMGFVGETRPLWGSKGVGDGPGGQGR
jgi:hypothetical protein